MFGQCEPQEERVVARSCQTDFVTSEARPTSVESAASSPVTRAGLLVAAAACAAVIVSHIFGRSTYSLLLPAISEDLVSSYGAAGFLGASYFAGYLLGVIGVTVMSSRIEPIVLLRTGLALSVLALATMGTAQRLSVFASGIFFVGLAGAGIWIPAPTIATSGLPARYRGLVMGALTATMGLGLLLLSQGTNLYRSVAGDDLVWRPIFGIEVVVTLLILVVAFVVVRRDRTAPAAAAASPPQRTPLFSLDTLRSVPEWKRLTLSYTIFACLAGSWVQFLGVVLSDDAGFSASHIANLFSVLAVAAVAGPLLIGRLSDRIGRDRSMAIAAGLTLVASLLLPLDQGPLAAVAVALYGAGAFAFPPITAAAVRDHLEGGAFATAFGTMTIIYATVSMVASQLAGLLADATGSFDAVYWILAAASAGSVTISLLRDRSHADGIVATL